METERGGAKVESIAAAIFGMWAILGPIISLAFHKIPVRALDPGIFPGMAVITVGMLTLGVVAGLCHALSFALLGAPRRRSLTLGLVCGLVGVAAALIVLAPSWPPTSAHLYMFIYLGGVAVVVGYFVVRFIIAAKMSSVQSNSALVSDACAAALRASFSAAQRGR